ELARNIVSPGVTGTLTRDQALARLLAGTGMSYRFTSPDTVTLERLDPLNDLVNEAKKPLRVAENEATQAAPRKTGQDEPTVLEEMTVTASPSDATSYNVPNATTATKTDTPIMETPATINVITRAQLDDRKVLDVREAFKYTSGVNPASGERGPYNGSLTLRGFSNEEQPSVTGSFIYRDGFRAIGVPVSIANIERLELLKGPATVLYGRAERPGQRGVQATSRDPVLLPGTAVRLFRPLSDQRGRHRARHPGRKSALSFRA
ncbi:MAG: TonB-dependent receptor plug domain-containing protein, partial [Planctomycetia bacterium]|nr:TonB-dependent receptor plug domain-containing protein [Planctomycetia bacterium]